MHVSSCRMFFYNFKGDNNKILNYDVKRFDHPMVSIDKCSLAIVWM